MLLAIFLFLFCIRYSKTIKLNFNDKLFVIKSTEEFKI